MVKTCPTCGKKFNAYDGREKYCSTCLEKAKLKSAPRKTFLTIPDAPNYEINGDYVIRNKKTGYILRPCNRTDSKTATKFYRLSTDVVPLGTIFRSDIAYRRQAVIAAGKESFEPIPSVSGKYEISQTGTVRNVRTKKAVKPNIKGVFTLWNAANDPVYRSRNSLLWEVYGKVKAGSAPIEVHAEHQNKRYTFASCAECARFLLGKIPFALNTIQCYLWKKKPSFAGWNFFYVNQLAADIPWDSKGLNKLARRDKKLASS